MFRMQMLAFYTCAHSNEIFAFLMEKHRRFHQCKTK